MLSVVLNVINRNDRLYKIYPNAGILEYLEHGKYYLTVYFSNISA